MTALDSLKDDLADYSRDDLVRLIGEMVERHPDLRSRIKQRRQKRSAKSAAISQSAGLLVLQLHLIEGQTCSLFVVEETSRGLMRPAPERPMQNILQRPSNWK